MASTGDDKTSTGSILKDLIFNQYQVILLGGAAAASLISLNPLPLLALLGGEFILLPVLDSGPLRRLVNRRRNAVVRRDMEARRARLIASFTSEYSKRYRDMENICRMIESNYQGLNGTSQAYLSEQREKLDLILDGCLSRMLALQRYDRMLASRNAEDVKEEITGLENEMRQAGLPDRARTALQKNIELKKKLIASDSEARGTVMALATELDSMSSLLEVLHQNSIAMRDPQTFSHELDSIVRQSEDSERMVREMESLLGNSVGDLTVDDIPASPISVTDKNSSVSFKTEGKETMTDAVESYPKWARKLAHAIRARLGNTYILHGNTHDLVGVPGADTEGKTRFVPVAAFLSDWIFGQREVVIEYQRANGAIFHTPQSHKIFMDSVEVVDAIHGTDLARSLPRDPGTVFSLLDSFLKQAVRREQPLGVAILFPYAETLIPESSGDSGAEDRAIRVFIQKWSTDPALLAANVTFVLVTENLADISTRIVRSPQTIEIEVERPGEPERLAFLEFIRDGNWFQSQSDLPAARLAQLTSGLTRIQLRQIVSSVDERKGRLDAATLREQKKAVIEAECFGLLEYVESKFTLDMVSGHEGIKERLRRAAAAILAGRLRGVPMGYLIAGPVGSAKTFMVNCFTGELGFPCVKFLNFRSQWQGVTEGNLEKILKLLHAMWPVGVIIDEADAFLGDRNQGGDSGTSNRVFAQIASFMGNTEYRGKILWFLITCRPDLLPIDLKRQGRAEEHLALFYPETDEEYDALFRIMMKKSGLKTSVQSMKEVMDDPRGSGLSGADIEAILARAALIADAKDSGGQGDESVSVEILRRVFHDFIPATSQLERELQVLAGVQECTSREVLPERYRNLDRSVIQARINELNTLLAGL